MMFKLIFFLCSLMKGNLPKDEQEHSCIQINAINVLNCSTFFNKDSSYLPIFELEEIANMSQIRKRSRTKDS